MNEIKALIISKLSVHGPLTLPQIRQKCSPSEITHLEKYLFKYHRLGLFCACSKLVNDFVITKECDLMTYRIMAYTTQNRKRKKPHTYSWGDESIAAD